MDMKNKFQTSFALGNSLCRLILFVLVSSFSVASFAADGYEDFGTSVSAGVSKRLWRRLDLGLEEEFRFCNNSQDFERWATSVDASYILCRKVLKIGVGYDLLGVWDYEASGFEFRHRFNAYFTLKHDIGRFNASWKSRFQSTYRNESLGDYSWNPRNYWRNKVGLSYNIRKCPITPFVAFECFYRPDYYKGHFIDCLRYEGGLKYSVTKRQTLEGLFKYDYEIGVKNPERMSRVCLSYKFEF